MSESDGAFIIDGIEHSTSSELADSFMQLACNVAFWLGVTLGEAERHQSQLVAMDAALDGDLRKKVLEAIMDLVADYGYFDIQGQTGRALRIEAMHVINGRLTMLVDDTWKFSQLGNEHYLDARRYARRLQPPPRHGKTATMEAARYAQQLQARPPRPLTATEVRILQDNGVDPGAVWSEPPRHLPNCHDVTCPACYPR